MKLVVFKIVCCILLSSTTYAATLPPPSPNYYVTLTWQPPTSSSDPVAGYNIYSAINNSKTYSRLNGTPVTTTNYTDNQIIPGDSYDYYVKSVDAQGVESAPSNTWGTTIPFIPYSPILGTPVVQ